MTDDQVELVLDAYLNGPLCARGLTLVAQSPKCPLNCLSPVFLDETSTRASNISCGSGGSPGKKL
jgi:hypothetical protein